MMKRAVNIFRENVKTLLHARRDNAASWAEFCGHDKSWASKILTGEREIQLADLDKTADYFGVTPYQLFQPGLSPLTERRTSQDRRVGDRRQANRLPDELFNQFRQKRTKK